MNQWPIYSHIKMAVQRTGKFPTNREIVTAFPGATLEDIREGTIEAKLQYEREWKNQKSYEQMIEENKQMMGEAMEAKDMQRAAWLGMGIIKLHKMIKDSERRNPGA